MIYFSDSPFTILSLIHEYKIILITPFIFLTIVPYVINQYKASEELVYSLVNTILKVMAQLQMVFVVKIQIYLCLLNLGMVARF